MKTYNIYSNLSPSPLDYIDPNCDISSIDFSALPSLFKIYSALEECFVFYKDLGGNYLACNKYMANKLELLNERSIIGLNDYDLSWRDIAHKCRANDADILKTQQKNIFIEDGILPNQIVVETRSNKFPVFKNSHLIGVLGIAYVVHNTNNQLPFNAPGLYLKSTERVPTLQKHSLGLELSARQIDCIKLLMQGLSVKKIAKNLNLSPRTVESHLNIARDKLNCSNKISLIATCLKTQQYIFCD